MQENPYYEPPSRRHVLERIEVRDGIVAMVVLTISFALVLAPAQRGVAERIEAFLGNPVLILVSFLAALTGFLLHEIAHKVVAQYYGCWAEFRAFRPGLALAFIGSLLLGLLMALPGAVMIRGSINARQNGIISLAGPGTNLVMAIVVLPFTFLPGMFGTAASLIGLVNAVLGAFNMIPFLNFDGKKIYRWNPFIWVVTTLVLIGFITLYVLLRPLDL